MDTAEFFVAGEPVPQGSTKAFYIKKQDRVVTTHTNKNTEVWRQRIATEAQHALKGYYEDDRRIGHKVELNFTFTRPKSQPKSWPLNTKRPDLDKLDRAVLDALTNIAFPDDSQVITLNSHKAYAERNELPGLRIRISKVRGP